VRCQLGDDLGAGSEGPPRRPPGASSSTRQRARSPRRAPPRQGRQPSGSGLPRVPSSAVMQTREAGSPATRTRGRASEAAVDMSTARRWRWRRGEQRCSALDRHDVGAHRDARGGCTRSRRTLGVRRRDGDERQPRRGADQRRMEDLAGRRGGIVARIVNAQPRTFGSTISRQCSGVSLSNPRAAPKPAFANARSRRPKASSPPAPSPPAGEVRHVARGGDRPRVGTELVGERRQLVAGAGSRHEPVAGRPRGGRWRHRCALCAGDEDDGIVGHRCSFSGRLPQPASAVVLAVSFSGRRRVGLRRRGRVALEPGLRRRRRVARDRGDRRVRRGLLDDAELDEVTDHRCSGECACDHGSGNGSPGDAPATH
jgi:hypothetical protein